MGESQLNVTGSGSRRGRSVRGLVRIHNRPFESPRGRGQNNPGWGRVDGRPFVSQRGRGRMIPVQARTGEGPDSEYENILSVDKSSDIFDPEEEDLQQDDNNFRPAHPFEGSDGRWYVSGLVRLDNKPFESPRGRGRNNPGWGRVDGRPFVSQRGRSERQARSVNYATPSAPSYENIMDIE